MDETTTAETWDVRTILDRCFDLGGDGRPDAYRANYDRGAAIVVAREAPDLEAAAHELKAWFLRRLAGDSPISNRNDAIRAVSLRGGVNRIDWIRVATVLRRAAVVH